MQYQGIIFDLDGVLCSTDEYHYRAWKALADRLGIPFDRERNGLLRGVSRMDSLNIILEKSDKAYSQDEKNAMAEEKNTRYRQLLNQMSPADLSGDVKRTLDTLRARGGWPTRPMRASSSPAPTASRTPTPPSAPWPARRWPNWPAAS